MVTIGTNGGPTTFFWVIFCLLLDRQCQIRSVHCGVIHKESSPLEHRPKTNYFSDDIVEVKFLTSKRRRRDIEFNSGMSEIIEIRGEFENKTLEMHVTAQMIKTTDFKVVVKDGNVTLEEYWQTDIDCLYKGVDKSDISAKVAISLCGNEGEISGLILSDYGDWTIEPLPVTSHDNNLTAKKHRIHKRAAQGGDLATLDLTTDQLHVPREKLEAAAELAAADAKAAATESEPTEEDGVVSLEKKNDKTVDVMNVSTHDVIPLDAPVAMAFTAAENYVDEVEVLASKSKAKKQENKATKEIVEIAVFTDPEFYNEMKIRYPKDTTEKIKDYILTVIHAVDLLYEHKSLGTDLTLKLVHLEIMQTLPKVLKKNGKSAKDYLVSFCSYAASLNKNGALWDHGLLLTGSDLKEADSNLIAGLAWAGTMCIRDFSCSVSEALQLGTIYVIGHELGHSLGMDHDGSGTSEACDSTKFLMSPTTGPGKVTWSTCSSKDLKNFIKKGSPDLRLSKKPFPPTCLTTLRKKSTEIEFKDGKLPGQKFDTKKQCQLALGKKFTPHMTKQKPFNAVCSMLYCANTTHAVGTHAALEGSECATGKICRGGECASTKK